MNYDVRQITKQFQIYGDYIGANPYGSGHINDTMVATFSQGGSELRYTFQRINHLVFNDPPSLMDNIMRVTNHIRNKLLRAGLSDVSRRVLTVVPTRDGMNYYQDSEGNYWRCLLFIEKARTYDVLERLDQAFEAAKAFGEFQGQLVDLPEPVLFETIPNFHNAQKRYQAFLDVLNNDPCNRGTSTKTEIDFLNTNAALFDVLPKLVDKGDVPIRTTHNDTKINNVMIDDLTHKGICVIDLDTVMPGLALYDFGDIVRTTVSNSEEDEQDVSKVKAEFTRFEAVVKGYLSGAGDILNRTEVDHLVHAGKLITTVMGMRFLTDYLAGDHYYKISRESHNLDRCRTQFKLVQSLIEQEESLDQSVKKCYQGIVKEY